jgi:hypothetical protein
VKYRKKKISTCEIKEIRFFFRDVPFPIFHMKIFLTVNSGSLKRAKPRLSLIGFV